MVIEFIKRSSILLLCIITISSCDVKDSFMDNCYRPYLLKVVVSDDANDGFHPEFFNPDDISLMMEPHEVLVYVFSKEMIFLGAHRTIVNDLIELPYKNDEQIFVAAVATAEGEPIDSLFYQFEKDKQYNKSDLLFTLTPMKEKKGIMQSPVDFMYASDNFKKNPYDYKNIIYYLYLEPKIGAVKIVTRGLEAWADSIYSKTGLLKDEFTFLVDTTLDSYNLGGVLYGNPAKYTPPTVYSDNEVITPMFNLMPNQTSGIRVYIYRNGIPIYPTEQYRGKSYRIFPRSPYIIVIDFHEIPDAGINVIPNEFDSYIIHVEF